MADTISQIKIDDTIYDICDYNIRNDAIIVNYYRINRTTTRQSINANSILSFSWNGISDLSNKFYLSYLEYNIDSHLCFPVAFTQEVIVISNRYTSSRSIQPTAVQLWFNVHY